MSTTEESDHRQPQTPLHRSASQPKPKGILKNAPHSQGSQPHSLQWDEENLALTEIQKDSLMKITEPKTPYVRYNAETDEIEGEIPHLNLGGHYSESPPQSPISSTGADTSGPSSRRTSISSSGRPGSGRSNSASSSRSTSFSLPNDSRKEIRLGSGERGGEVEMEEEMDAEAAEKHAAFLRARGRHYSGEAEAMRRAKQLLDKEEEEDDKMGGDKGADGEEEVDVDGGEEAEWPVDEGPEHKVNGI